METRIPAEQAMALLRGQRHSFLNHLQVISGWLQLDRPERARHYLEMVAARVSAEADLMRSLPPSMAVWVVHLLLEAETNGVQLEWQLSDLSRPIHEEWWRWLGDEVKAAALWPEEHRKFVVTQGADGSLMIHTPARQGEG